MCGGGGYEEKEPESKLALAQQAAVSLQRYGETFVPLENAFIQDNLNAFGSRAYERDAGQMSTAISGEYENQLGDFQTGLYQAGADPTSGRYQGNINSIRKAQARGMGEGRASSGIGNTNQAYAGLTNVVKAGQGLNTTALEGNVSRLNDQLALAKDQADLDFQKASGPASVAGLAAGGATGAYMNSKGTV